MDKNKQGIVGRVRAFGRGHCISTEAGCASVQTVAVALEATHNRELGVKHVWGLAARKWWE